MCVNSGSETMTSILLKPNISQNQENPLLFFFPVMSTTRGNSRSSSLLHVSSSVVNPQTTHRAVICTSHKSPQLGLCTCETKTSSPNSQSLVALKFHDLLASLQHALHSTTSKKKCFTFLPVFSTYKSL